MNKTHLDPSTAAAAHAAEPTLAPASASPHAALVQRKIAARAVQRRQAVQMRRQSKDNPDWTSSDNGKAIVVGSQDLYAAQDLIDQGNGKLATAGKDGSFIKLQNDGQEYEHEGHTLTKVVPKWVDHKNMGDHQGSADANKQSGADSNGIATKDNDTMALWADCGRSSGAVTGSIDQNNRDRQAVYQKDGKETLTAGRLDAGQHRAAKNSVGRMANAIYFDLMPGFLKDPKHLPYLVEGVHYTKGGDGAAVPKVPADGVEAQQLYGKMTADGQKAFDKAAGINHYANPQIGEAYAMGTGYNLPGFKERSGNSTWNFHWAGVIMKDGGDNITLENYAVIAEGIDRFINRDWNFALYGTMKGNGKGEDQTFHHDHLASKTHGTKATSIAVRSNK